MRPYDKYPLTVGVPPDHLPLYLRRFRGKQDAPVVVLLHGGNTSGDTFLYPEDGLAGFLQDRGWDVWILEWRSSPHIVDPLIHTLPPLGGSVLSECQVFTLDNVVAQEIPMALAKVREEVGWHVHVAVMGHCLGSSALALAIARGKLEDARISNVVLSTMGLFFEVPWNTWIKAEDFLMERVVHDDPKSRGVNPRALGEWPSDMQKAYDLWPKAWLPHYSSSEGRCASVDERLLRLLTFMFGQPYAINRLHPSLRGPEILKFFGSMHLGLYQHVSQMVRRGYAAPFNAPDVIDRPRLAAGPVGLGPASDLDPTHFIGKRITLLVAAENHLWHRDSADLMYEWLRSNTPPSQRSAYRKHVFAGYGLQELMWGVRARQDVFPAIEAAISAAGQQNPPWRRMPTPPTGLAAA